MTTIAYDGEMLAADSLIVDGNTKNYGTKIKSAQKSGKLFLTATCGNSGMGRAMLSWWLNDESISLFPQSRLEGDSSTNLIVIEKNKPILVFIGSPYPLELTNDIYAAGSGRDFALAAMHCGLNAKQAVEMARKLDVFTGGEIYAIDFTVSAL